MSMIQRYNDTGTFYVNTNKLEEGQMLTFIDLAELKESVDQMFSDEQSRLLMLELSGDYACDGCTI